MPVKPISVIYTNPNMKVPAQRFRVAFGQCTRVNHGPWGDEVMRDLKLGRNVSITPTR